MKLLDELVKDYEDFQEEVCYTKNYCNNLFNKMVSRADVDEDTYQAAKAFTSIVNQIVNRKLDYITFVAAGQIELSTFLNTFDDKYLSNAENLLESQNCNEQVFLTELDEDITNIVSFLEDFFKSLTSKNNPFKIEDELLDFLKGLYGKRGED